MTNTIEDVGSDGNTPGSYYDLSKRMSE